MSGVVSGRTSLNSPTGELSPVTFETCVASVATVVIAYVGKVLISTLWDRFTTPSPTEVAIPQREEVEEIYLTWERQKFPYLPCDLHLLTKPGITDRYFIRFEGTGWDIDYFLNGQNFGEVYRYLETRRPIIEQDRIRFSGEAPLSVLLPNRQLDFEKHILIFFRGETPGESTLLIEKVSKTLCEHQLWAFRPRREDGSRQSLDWGRVNSRELPSLGRRLFLHFELPAERVNQWLEILPDRRDLVTACNGDNWVDRYLREMGASPEVIRRIHSLPRPSPSVNLSRKVRFSLPPLSPPTAPPSHTPTPGASPSPNRTRRQ